MKEQIKMINETAQVNFDMAEGMLQMLNTIYGTKFDFLNRRVVRFDNPDESTCFKYAHAHDAWAEL